MNDIREWISSMWLVLALSLLGGMARAAKCGERSLWSWFCSMLVALFSGVVTHMLLADLAALPETAKVACASVSAYSGGVILDALQARIAEMAGALLGSRAKSTHNPEGDHRG